MLKLKLKVELELELKLVGAVCLHESVMQRKRAAPIVEMFLARDLARRAAMQ
jgi:hypothetical protein